MKILAQPFCSVALAYPVVRSRCALVMASRVRNTFWHMAGDLGYEECFPDEQGCAPLTGQEIPWWALFFSL